MIEEIRKNLGKVIIGKKDVIDKAIVGLLSDGHMLIEDVPGIGKTTLAKAIAISFGAKFKRIQFTPDLLPSDITGITIYDLYKNDFKVRFGPVFTNFLLADEINRGTPKTQSALLEAMAEYRVSIDGVDYSLDPPFIVIATENPIEYEGTFPLPEAQLDRFIMRFSIGYPEKTKEKDILYAGKEIYPIDSLEQTCTVGELIEAQKVVRKVFVHNVVAEYIIELSSATRAHGDIYLGVSPRGSLFLMRVSQAWAFIAGRDFVIPDDVKKGIKDVFNHRVLLRADARLRGVSVDAVLGDIVQSVKVPVIEDFSEGAPA